MFKAIKKFIRNTILLSLAFVAVVAYAEGRFDGFGDFLREFRPRTAIAPVSDFSGLDGARIDLFGLEVQGKDFIDDDLFLLEFGRIMQESGYSTHGLAAYCSTSAGKRLFGGEESCLLVNPDNAVDVRRKVREEQRVAFEAAGCHRKRGVKGTYWSPGKRQERCKNKVLKRMYG